MMRICMQMWGRDPAVTLFAKVKTVTRTVLSWTMRQQASGCAATVVLVERWDRLSFLLVLWQAAQMWEWHQSDLPVVGHLPQRPAQRPYSWNPDLLRSRSATGETGTAAFSINNFKVVLVREAVQLQIGNSCRITGNDHWQCWSGYGCRRTLERSRVSTVQRTCFCSCSIFND